MKKIVCILLLSLLLLDSCHKKEEVTTNLLLKYKESELTIEDVISKIPGGLSASDSARLFTSIVEGWIKDEVLADFAQDKLLDMNNIERRVKDYRNNLIVQEYLSRMRETQPVKIEENKVKEYYDLHKNELNLEVPLVKGIFIKINANSKGKENIKKLLGSENPEELDYLESEWLDKAVEYNYFRDKWIDWETVENLIPIRFEDPASFLSEHPYFETEQNEFSYHLQITDYMPAGSIQPYEFAALWIKALLTRGNLIDYENNLVTSIVMQAVKDKRLEVYGYDPLNKTLNNIMIEK